MHYLSVTWVGFHNTPVDNTQSLLAATSQSEDERCNDKHINQTSVIIIDFNICPIVQVEVVIKITSSPSHNQFTSMINYLLTIFSSERNHDNL